ncbi:MAG: ABC transporter permease [Dehalococcoidia bacterium]|nr:ABC transporter permease [Dehalococcoidia bacterium]
MATNTDVTTIAGPRVGGWDRALVTAGRIVRRYPLAVTGGVIVLTFLLMAIFAPLIATHDPLEADGRNAFQTPSAEHWFGTDGLGRDIFSRIVYGSRVSIQVGAMAVFFAGGIGVPFGLLAGYRGGIVDAVVMRMADAIIAFPGLILALTLVMVLGPSAVNIMLAIGIGAAPGYARLIRSQVLYLKTLDYVTASRSIGATDVRIIWKHIWPNARASIIVAASLTMGGAVLAEASLGFLGVGIRPPTPTWGRMLNDSFSQIYNAPWLSIFPGAAIFLITLAFNLVGDGLRDALDPRLRRSGR